jgi:hypothetical protein
VRQGAQTSAPTSNTTRLLYSLELCVARPLDEHLGLNTSYSYAIRKGGNRPHGMNEAEVTATVTADSIYGAMHGMESFAQLAFAGSVPSANVTVRDGPDFPWCGLMLDVERRLSPVPLLENMLDTMVRPSSTCCTCTPPTTAAGPSSRCSTPASPTHSGPASALAAQIRLAFTRKVSPEFTHNLHASQTSTTPHFQASATAAH